MVCLQLFLFFLNFFFGGGGLEYGLHNRAELNPFPAIVFELYSSIARALGL